MTQLAVFIVGIGGMDGSFLADLLLSRGYEVHGIARHSSTGNLGRIRHLIEPEPRITLHDGDLSDPGSIHRVIADVRPGLLFNEADQDHVGFSHRTPGYSLDITAGAVARLLESVRQIDQAIRVFQPVSATMFGDAPPPQNERTPFDPMSPYAVAKVAAYHLCRYYRQVHGLWVSTAILYNHDSARRGGDYLLQRICRGAVAIARGEMKQLTIGDPAPRVDIGYAGEYMEAALSIMQLDTPGDFVIGTGQGWTVRHWTELALAAAGVHGYPVLTDYSLMPPGKPPTLVADCSKAKAAFGWSPQWDARRLVQHLVEHHQFQATLQRPGRAYDRAG